MRMSASVQAAALRCLLAGGALSVAIGQSLSGQGRLSLQIELGKRDFFEGEPVYSAVKLRNEGSEITMIPAPDLTADGVRLSLYRSDTILMPEIKIWVDYTIAPNYRPVPIAPGETRYLLVVLQDRWGTFDGNEVVFHRHLGVGEYTLLAEFATDPTNPSGEVGLLTASPIRFTVRARTASEDALFNQVARVRGMVWDRNKRSGYLAELIRLTEDRLNSDAQDPFLPFLIDESVVTAEVAGQRPNSTQLALLTRIRLTVATAQQTMPGGALAALAWLRNKKDTTDVATLIAGGLGRSLAAEVLTERANRKQ